MQDDIDIYDVCEGTGQQTLNFGSGLLLETINRLTITGHYALPAWEKNQLERALQQEAHSAMVRVAAGFHHCRKVWFHAAVTAGLLPEGQDRWKPSNTWALHLDLLTHGLAYLESTQVLGTGSAHWCAPCLPQIQPQRRAQLRFSFSCSYMLGSKRIFPIRQRILLRGF